MSRKGGLFTALWGITSLLFLISALLTQAILYVIVAVLAALVGALAAWTDTTGEVTVPAARPKRGPAANPRGKRSPGGSSVPRCTKTGRPIDVCGCAQRHVATSDGAARYKRSVGDPMGGKAGGRKPSSSSPAAPVRKSARKSDWYDTVDGKKCSTCKGTGAGTDTTLRGGGSCRTCRGFGKVA